jgi:hypothetical protein
VLEAMKSRRIAPRLAALALATVQVKQAMSYRRCSIL